MRLNFKLVRNIRLGAALLSSGLVIAGVLILAVASFAHAEAVGGLIAAAGAGALLAELTDLPDRARAVDEAKILKLTLERLEAGAVFASFRTAAVLGAVLTQCAFGSESPDPGVISRFNELCNALGLGTFEIPAAGNAQKREAEGLAIYRSMKQVLTDRHGESVAGVFAFEYGIGVLMGGSGSVVPELASKVVDLLFALPDDLPKAYVTVLLGEWVQGQLPTATLREEMVDVAIWLQNYGSKRPEIVAISNRLRLRTVSRGKTLKQVPKSDPADSKGPL